MVVLLICLFEWLSVIQERSDAWGVGTAVYFHSDPTGFHVNFLHASRDPQTPTPEG